MGSDSTHLLGISLLRLEAGLAHGAISRGLVRGFGARCLRGDAPASPGCLQSRELGPGSSRLSATAVISRPPLSTQCRLRIQATQALMVSWGMNTLVQLWPFNFRVTSNTSRADRMAQTRRPGVLTGHLAACTALSHVLGPAALTKDPPSFYGWL